MDEHPLNCSACGAATQDADRFCGGCGRELPPSLAARGREPDSTAHDPERGSTARSSEASQSSTAIPSESVTSRSPASEGQPQLGTDAAGPAEGRKHVRRWISTPGRLAGAAAAALALVAVVLMRGGDDPSAQASPPLSFGQEAYAASGRPGSGITVAVIVHANPGLTHLTFTATLEDDPFPLLVLNEPAGAVSELVESVEFAVPVEARPGLGDAGTHIGEVVAVGCTEPLEDGQCPLEAELSVRAKVTVGVEALDPEVVPEDFTIPHAGRFESAPDGDVVADELLLLTDGGVDAADVRQTALEAARSVGALVVGADAEAGIFQLAFADLSQPQMNVVRRELGRISGVESVLPHSLIQVAGAHLPDDYDDEPWTVDAPAGRNWHLELIDAPSAWERRTGSDDVSVGIIDAGFRTTHEDLRDNIRKHRSFGLGDGTARGHGSMVAGIACARGNNARGISGVTQKCSLQLYELPEEEKSFPDVVVFQAMRNAIADEIEVANLSLGANGCDEGPLMSADASGYRRYVEKSPDTLWVIAAGNSCTDAVSTIPANLGADTSLGNVLVVAAVNSDNTLAPFSNFGGAVAVAAPGGWDMTNVRDDSQRSAVELRALAHRSGVWSTWNCWNWRLGWCWGSDRGYTGDVGTSMAAPVVTGLVALARAAAPNATAAEIRSCIITGARASGQSAQRPPDWLWPDLPRRFTDDDLAALPIVNAGATLECLHRQVATSPMFRAGPARTGVYPGPAVAGPPAIRWQFDAGDSVSSSPAVADGVVYVGSARRGDGGSLYALDAMSGDELWRFRTGVNVESSPAVSDGVVYVGSNDGNLYAVNATSGEELWHFATDHPVQSSPAVVDGVVYVGSEDGNLYAVETTSGEEVWRFPTGDWVFFSSPAVLDGVVYVGSHDGNLYAVDASSGQERWRYSTDGELSSSPAVADGTVYVGSGDGGLYAIDAETGRQRWRFSASDEVFSSPAVGAGTVYVGSLDSNLYAVDAASGQELWRLSTSDWVASSPALAEGTVYVGSRDGNLYAADASSGQELWRFPTGDWVFSSPAVVGGAVFIGNSGGTVYAVAMEPDPTTPDAVTPSASETAHSLPALAALRPDGIGDYDFGSGFDIVVTGLAAADTLGSWQMDKGPGCVGYSMHVFDERGLHLLFTSGREQGPYRLESWSLDAFSGDPILSTPNGATIGSKVSVVADEYGGQWGRGDDYGNWIWHTGASPFGPGLVAKVRDNHAPPDRPPPDPSAVPIWMLAAGTEDFNLPC